VVGGGKGRQNEQRGGGKKTFPTKTKNILLVQLKLNISPCRLGGSARVFGCKGKKQLARGGGGGGEERNKRGPEEEKRWPWLSSPHISLKNLGKRKMGPGICFHASKGVQATFLPSKERRGRQNKRPGEGKRHEGTTFVIPYFRVLLWA